MENSGFESAARRFGKQISPCFFISNLNGKEKNPENAESNRITGFNLKKRSEKRQFF